MATRLDSYRAESPPEYTNGGERTARQVVQYFTQANLLSVRVHVSPQSEHDLLSGTAAVTFSSGPAALTGRMALHCPALFSTHTSSKTQCLTVQQALLQQR